MSETSDRRDAQILDVFEKTVNAMGGFRLLAETRRLGWLPSLLASADILLLQEAERQTPEAIADLLAINLDTVENILAAPTDRADDYRGHTLPEPQAERELGAGVLVKQAFFGQSGAHPPG